MAEERGDTVAGGVEDVAEAVRQRLADGEDDLEDSEDDSEEDERSPDAVQEDAVDAFGGLVGDGRFVAGAGTDAHGPLAIGAEIADDGEFDFAGGEAGVGIGFAIEELVDGVEAGAASGADFGDGDAEFLGKAEGIDLAAARFHEVAHVEQDQGGQAESEDGRGKHELAAEVQRIEN